MIIMIGSGAVPPKIRNIADLKREPPPMRFLGNRILALNLILKGSYI
jgi:hypothetical protein